MGIFSKSIKSPVFDVNWQLKNSIRMDADDLDKIESAEVIDGLWGKNLKINLKAGGNWRKKISPRVDVSRLPIGTQVPLTSIALCTLSKPGEDDIQNFEIDGYLLPEYQPAEQLYCFKYITVFDYAMRSTFVYCAQRFVFLCTVQQLLFIRH